MRNVQCVATAVCVSLCVSTCLSACPLPHSHTKTGPDISWGNGRGCPLAVHDWAYLQSVHGFVADNIAPNTKCQRLLVLALCLASLLGTMVSKRPMNVLLSSAYNITGYV